MQGSQVGSGCWFQLDVLPYVEPAGPREIHQCTDATGKGIKHGARALRITLNARMRADDA